MYQFRSQCHVQFGHRNVTIPSWPRFKSQDHFGSPNGPTEVTIRCRRGHEYGRSQAVGKRLTKKSNRNCSRVCPNSPSQFRMAPSHEFRESQLGKQEKRRQFTTRRPVCIFLQTPFTRGSEKERPQEKAPVVLSRPCHYQKQG